MNSGSAPNGIESARLNRIGTELESLVIVDRLALYGHCATYANAPVGSANGRSLRNETMGYGQRRHPDVVQYLPIFYGPDQGTRTIHGVLVGTLNRTH